MLASLITPLAMHPARAATETAATLQDDGASDAATESGATGATETPVADETPAPDEGYIFDEEGPVVDTNAQAGYTSSISVSMSLCDSDFGGDLQQLRHGCKGGLDIAIEVYYGGALKVRQQASYFGDGLPAGEYAIRADPPPGYDLTLTLCRLDPAGVETALVPVTVVDGVYGFTLGDGETFACVWFQIATGASDPHTSTISVSMWQCANANVGDFQQLVTNCSAAPAIAFTVSGGDLRQSAQGSLAVANLPAGQYTLHEAIPAGYGEPLVFCGVAPPGELNEAVPVVTDDGSYEFALDVEQSIACYWFNVIPNAEVAISITERYCPEGFDAYNVDLETLREICQEDMGVWFALYNGFGAELGHGETGGDGDIAFAQLPPDLYNVVATIPEGYGAPVVFCTLTIATGEQSGVQPWATWLGDGTYGISETFNGGDILVCDWFDVPLDETISAVKVGARICPAGQDLDQLSLEELSDDVCLTPEAGVSFTLTGAVTGVIGPTPTGDNGELIWYGPPADQYTLTGEVPAGYGSPIVYCGIYRPDLDGALIYERYPVSTDNEIAFDLGQDEHALCYWFNVLPAEEELGELTIIKRFCPEDTATDYYAADPGSLYDRCQRYQGGEVEFDLYSHTSGETETRHTGSGLSGSAFWEAVPAGQVEVTEHAQAGYGAPRVFCFALGPDDGDPVPVEVADWSAAFTIPDALDVRCDWFNIPVLLPNGEIIVHVWDCPTGSNYPPSLASLYESCTAAKKRPFFHLTDETGGDDTRRTSKLSQVRWDDVAAGEYGLWAKPLKGYGQPVVFCSLVPDEGDWLPAPWPVAAGAIAFDHTGDGWVFVCDWFNVPDSSQLADEDGAIAKSLLISGPTGRDELLGRLRAI